MASASDIQKARDRVEKMRGQVAETRDSIAQKAREADGDLELARLTAEEDRLKNELEVLKEADKQLGASVKDQVTQISEGPTYPTPNTAAVKEEV